MNKLKRLNIPGYNGMYEIDEYGNVYSNSLKSNGKILAKCPAQKDK
jgi:hypothetical protein